MTTVIETETTHGTQFFLTHKRQLQFLFVAINLSRFKIIIIMKFTLTFVILCTFAVYSCIAEMEIDLEPTPLAFLGKYENQARDRCNLVNCASMDYTISVASAVFKQAESIYAAAVKVKDLAKPYCTPDYNGYVWVESESLICPTLSTLVSSKVAVRSEMAQTTAAYTSFI